MSVALKAGFGLPFISKRTLTLALEIPLKFIKDLREA